MNVPTEFICPITMEIMLQPMVTRYGHSFERTVIMAWVDNRHECPLTRQPLGLSDLIPHHYLVTEIAKWRAQNGLVEDTIRYSKGREYMQERYDKFECQQNARATISVTTTQERPMESSPTGMRSFLALGALRRKQTASLAAPPSRRNEHRRRISVLPRSR